MVLFWTKLFARAVKDKAQTPDKRMLRRLEMEFEVC
jgi:hypothetical protein